MASKRVTFQRSILVSFFSLLGALAGILVETSIASRLGLSQGSDTFYVAYTVPYVISNLLSITSQYSLVPFFGTLDARHTPEDLWRGFSYAVNVTFLGTATFALLAIVSAPWVIRGIAPGFTVQQSELAAELARWLFLIIIPTGVSEVFRSFLISQHRFALSSAAGFFTNAAVIASVVGLFGRFGYYSIVLGYLVGCLISLIFLGAQIVLAFPVRYSFTLQGSGDAFRKLHGAGAAQLGGAAAWQGVVIAERVIASFLPAGTLTALAYGLKILSALVDLLAGSVGTVSLPALSRAVAHQDHPEMRKLFRDVLEISMMFVLPAFIFCGLLSSNIIRLVFERGSFTPEATALLARVFFYYSLTILPFAFTRLLTFYFFARHEGGDYLRFALLLYSLTLMFDLVYVAGFRLGAKGIPLGLLTASLLAAALAYQRNVAGLRIDLDRALGWFTLKNLLAGSMASLAVFGLKWTVQNPQPGAANFVYLCELCGAGTVVFIAVLAATRALPVAQIFAEITRSEDS